jgi:hypothetical protein
MTPQRKQVHAIRRAFARREIDSQEATRQIEALGYADGHAVLIGKVKS